MNRNAEYTALLAELEQTPPALEYTVQRAMARKNTSRRKRRLLGVPLGSLAVCFTVFVLLVNLFPPFAYACGRVPLLRELAKAVAWSPSLSAAVENEYVQPIGQSQTVNGITATVQYLIVDQKQVHIFYTLKGKGYETLSAGLPEFTPSEGIASYGSGSGSGQPPGTLLSVDLDYVDQSVPDGFTMAFEVYGEREGDAPPAADQNALAAPAPTDQAPEGTEELPGGALAAFTFDLTFDPYFTAQGEVLSVNRTFELDGQTLTVTAVEVYPTHVRVNVEGDEANTAWLEYLDFYLEDQRGERFEPISNGISATGDGETPAMDSFWLESAYFSRSEHLSLHITGARWLDKDMERIRVDLEDRTMEALPQDVVLERIEREGNDWLVEFNYPESIMMMPFRWSWYEAQDAEQSSLAYRMLEPQTEDRRRMQLIFRGYEGEELWLCPAWSHTTVQDPPVVISVK